MEPPVRRKFLLATKVALDYYFFAKNLRYVAIFIANVFLLFVGVAATNSLLFLHPWNTPLPLRLLVSILCVQLVAIYLFRLHRGLWKYSSINDLLAIGKIAALSFVINFGILLFFRIGVSEAIRYDVIVNILFILDFSAMRLCVRLYKSIEAPQKGEKRVIIVGAGDAGELVCRHLQIESAPYRIIGFVDDDPKKLNRVVHGHRVLGRINDIITLTETRMIEEVVVAIPSATPQQLRSIVSKCSEAKISVKILPRLSLMLTNNASFEIKDIKIEDLLARDPVHINSAHIKSEYRGKRILITGAAGSIGEELTYKVAHMEPLSVYLLDQAESPLYFLYRDCLARFPNVNFIPVLCDIVDAVSLERCFKEARPEVVIHAAAYKHVPLLEGNIYQALMVNVRGTRNVARLAKQYESGKFILISTDKAVNPVNILGASKRIAELMCQALNENSLTKFIAVRFGNVLGSQGSVIPLFKKQIESGGPVTVTHPDIKRYFMMIPEAVQLVLLAASMGNGGEIFVLDMGEQVKILDLAQNLIRISGMTPDQDIKIEFSGLRPGEKLYEELYDTSEEVERTDYHKINRAIGVPEDKVELMEKIDACLELALNASPDQVLRNKIREIVVSYCPFDDSAQPADDAMTAAG